MILLNQIDDLLDYSQLIMNEFKLHFTEFSPKILCQEVMQLVSVDASVHFSFHCENNLYATHIHIRDRQPSERIIDRVKPFVADNAIRIENANDVIDVAKTAKSAVEKVRQNKPGFIEACTYRLREHWGVGEDWHLGYRSREEGEKWMAKCPLKYLRRIVEEMYLQLYDQVEISEHDFLISDDEIREWTLLIGKEVDEAVEFAFNSPPPSQEKLLSEVGG